MDETMPTLGSDNAIRKDSAAAKIMQERAAEARKKQERTKRLVFLFASPATCVVYTSEVCSAIALENERPPGGGEGKESGNFFQPAFWRRVIFAPQLTFSIYSQY